MKAIITVSELTLNNGCAKYAEGRTVMSETGLPADTQVEYVGRQSRWTGTGYSNYLYRIVGTDDLLTIRHNDGPVDNLSWDNVVVTKGYFAEQRSYGQRVGRLSRKYHIPFEVCLALGDNEELYPWFVNAMSDLDFVSIGTIRDLYAGINRRKSGLQAVLGDGLYETLNIGSMGQNNSERIARYVAKRCEDRLS